LNNLEKQTSIPKAYAFLGLSAFYFALVFFNIGGQFLTNVAGFVVPGYYSLEALFSVSKSDDTQWLTVSFSFVPISRAELIQLLQYWVVFAFFTVFESAVSAVYWFPFYYTFKFILVLWLALPVTGSVHHPSDCVIQYTNKVFSGAQIVFRSFIQPVFSRYFSGGGATAANLRSKVDSATSDKTL